MKRMVNEFSDYARLPAPTLAELDLNALIREVLGLYETSQAVITLDLDAALPPILGDATQLRQIIHNLLRNAEDAQVATAEPSIRLSTRRVGDMAEFAVTDAGPGFPEEIDGRGSSNPTSRPRPAAPGWGWRSSRRSSTNTAARSASTTVPRPAPRSACGLPLAPDRVTQSSLRETSEEN